MISITGHFRVLRVHCLASLQIELKQNAIAARWLFAYTVITSICEFVVQQKGEPVAHLNWNTMLVFAAFRNIHTEPPIELHGLAHIFDDHNNHIYIESHVLVSFLVWLHTEIVSDYSYQL